MQILSDYYIIILYNPCTIITIHIYFIRICSFINISCHILRHVRPWCVVFVGHTDCGNTTHASGVALYSRHASHSCVSHFIVPWKRNSATVQHRLSGQVSQKPLAHSHTFSLMNTICWLRACFLYCGSSNTVCPLLSLIYAWRDSSEFTQWARRWSGGSGSYSEDRRREGGWMWVDLM